MSKLYRKQQGIGLLELLLAISIISVMTIMAVSYYQSTSRAQRLAQATAMVSDIYSASKDYSKTGGTISINNMIDAGLLTNYYLTDPWDGDVTAKRDGSQVEIQLKTVPGDACDALQTRVEKTLSSSSESAACGTRKIFKKRPPKVTTFTVYYDLY